MQIHNNTLMAECSTYDFKSMLRRKEVKAWLKSVFILTKTMVKISIHKQSQLFTKSDFYL